MAHRLAADDSKSDSTDTDRARTGDQSLVLKRRKYLKIGAVAAAVVGVSTLTSAGDSGESTYYTDFSEGSL